MIYVIGLIILLLVILFFIVLFNYFKLKDIKESIETCALSIDELLNSKLELVEKILKKIKNEKLKSSFEYDKDSTLYEREDALFNISFEINKYIKESNNKKLKDDARELSAMEESLDGLKDFYNTNALNYNEIFFKKGLNKVFKLLKFEGYKSFKIRKLEEYEIFKN
ncbi:MAG: hypothetical protein IJL74_04495 [Bacilli bacterium]|nr:hypothetical protein [Bacilli bacterium]